MLQLFLKLLFCLLGGPWFQFLLFPSSAETVTEQWGLCARALHWGCACRALHWGCPCRSLCPLSPGPCTVHE